MITDEEMDATIEGQDEHYRQRLDQIPTCFRKRKPPLISLEYVFQSKHERKLREIQRMRYSTSV